jgi:hypothetical protein
MQSVRHLIYQSRRLRSVTHNGWNYDGYIAVVRMYTHYIAMALNQAADSESKGDLSLLAPSSPSSSAWTFLPRVQRKYA